MNIAVRGILPMFYLAPYAKLLLAVVNTNGEQWIDTPALVSCFTNGEKEEEENMAAKNALFPAIR